MLTYADVRQAQAQWQRHRGANPMHLPLTPQPLLPSPTHLTSTATCEQPPPPEEEEGEEEWEEEYRQRRRMDA